MQLSICNRAAIRAAVSYDWDKEHWIVTSFDLNIKVMSLGNYNDTLAITGFA